MDNIKDPLFRYFEREVNTGIALLNTVRQNLNDTILVCEAQKKPTNYLRHLMSDLAKGMSQGTLWFITLFNLWNHVKQYLISSTNYVKILASVDTYHGVIKKPNLEGNTKDYCPPGSWNLLFWIELFGVYTYSSIHLQINCMYQGSK